MDIYFSKSSHMGFLIGGVHELPSDAVKVTPEKRAEIIDGEAAGKIIDADENGFPILVDPEPETLTDMKAAKNEEINAEASKVAMQLTAGYADFEMKTWPQQEAEALAWEAALAVNSDVDTPMINIMAEERGIPRAEYLQKTLIKVHLFRNKSAKLVGQRQKFSDLVAAAQTAEQVASVMPVFNLE